MSSQAVSIKVAAAKADNACPVLGSKSYLNKVTQALIDRLDVMSLVQTGSLLNFCQLAEVAADIYPRLAAAWEWDTAAAQAVLEGAGGWVVDLQGMPLQDGKPDAPYPSFVANRKTASIST